MTKITTIPTTKRIELMLERGPFAIALVVEASLRLLETPSRPTRAWLTHIYRHLDELHACVRSDREYMRAATSCDTASRRGAAPSDEVPVELVEYVMGLYHALIDVHGDTIIEVEEGRDLPEGPNVIAVDFRRSRPGAVARRRPA